MPKKKMSKSKMAKLVRDRKTAAARVMPKEDNKLVRMEENLPDIPLPDFKAPPPAPDQSAIFTRQSGKTATVYNSLRALAIVTNPKLIPAQKQFTENVFLDVENPVITPHWMKTK